MFSIGLCKTYEFLLLLSFEALAFTDKKICAILAIPTLASWRITVFTAKGAARKTGTKIDAHCFIKLTLIDAQRIILTLFDTVVQCINALLGTNCSKFLVTKALLESSSADRLPVMVTYGHSPSVLFLDAPAEKADTTGKTRNTLISAIYCRK